MGAKLESPERSPRLFWKRTSPAVENAASRRWEVPSVPATTTRLSGPTATLPGAS